VSVVAPCDILAGARSPDRRSTGRTSRASAPGSLPPRAAAPSPCRTPDRWCAARGPLWAVGRGGICTLGTGARV